MNLPLYLIWSYTRPIEVNCYTSDDVRRELNKLRDTNIFRLVPSDVRVYLWKSWCDVTTEFI